MLSIRLFLASGTGYAILCFLQHDRIIPSLLLFVCSVVAQFLVPATLVINCWHVAVALIIAFVPLALQDYYDRKEHWYGTNSTPLCLTFSIVIAFLVGEQYLT